VTEQAAADRRPVACRVPVACPRASNPEPACSAQSFSEPVPPLARPTAAAKAQATQRRRRQQCRQPQRQRPAMILHRPMEAGLLEAAVLQPETAAETQEMERAARLSGSAQLDWSP
jgi:hypothetical protein